MIPQLSRAALLQCLAAHGPEEWDRLAGALGYAPQAAPPKLRAILASLPAFTVEIKNAPPPPPPPTPQTHFLRPLSRRRLVPEDSEAPPWFEQAEAFSQDDDPDLAAPAGAKPPPAPPLMPWPRLWPFLKLALGAVRASRQPDLPRLLETLARGQWLRRLPRVQRLGWAGDCLLLIDFAEPLRPFWGDFHALKQRLPGLRGAAGLTVCAFPDGDPLGRCWREGAEGWQNLPRFPLPSPGMAVLVLGDLGCNDSGGQRRQAWRRFGARLKAAACRPVALLPCPPRRWDGGLARLFDLACWDRAARLPRQRGRAVGLGRAGSDDAAAARLLALLSPAIRVEPALLRATRFLLPAGQADVGAEASAWNHPDVRPTPTAFYYHAAAHAAYRERFRADGDIELKQAVARLIAAHHAPLSPFIPHEEALALAELLGEAAPAGRWQQRLAKTCAGDGSLAEAARAWVERMAGRGQPPGVWPAHPALAAAWAFSYRQALARNQVAAIPPGLSLRRVAWALAEPGKGGRWTLRQIGAALHAEPQHPLSPRERVGVRANQKTQSMADATTGDGIPVIELEATAPFLSLTLIDEAATAADFFHPAAAPPPPIRLSLAHPMPTEPAPSVPLALEQPIPLPEAGLFRLGSDREDWLFDQLSKPDWAEGIGRDRQGLYVEVQAGPERLRLYWQVAEAGQDEAWQLGGNWGGFEALGRDEFGLWADLALYVWTRQTVEDTVAAPLAYYRRIVQRFRRILPGLFLMGSPPNEPERYDDETQHEVTLSQGFWLADSACTQAFWQAVAGDNPSRFKDNPANPVENVSWNDAQGFIASLNKRVPGLGARLPSEAEWEYACRAGTATPFSFGANITPEQVNYDGNYPYAGGRKGEYREKTVLVRSLPPNPWGLYEMHGNVWEWCQDWYGDYGAGPCLDPLGPSEGEYRVLRGGSWILYGWDVRSAHRNWFEPDYRSGSFGFRLALGSTGSGQQAAEPPPPARQPS